MTNIESQRALDKSPEAGLDATTAAAVDEECAEASGQAASNETAGVGSQRRMHRKLVLHIVLWVVIALLLVAGTVLFVLTHAQRADQDRDATVLAVARQTAMNMLTIDKTNAKKTLRDLENVATGEFKQQLIGASGEFIRAVTESKVNAQGTISAVGIRKASDSNATALVSAVGEVKNIENPQGEPRQYRMVLDLRRDADTGAWLVAKLEFVP